MSIIYIRENKELLEHYKYEIETLEQIRSLVETIDSRSPSYYEVLDKIISLISFNEKMKSNIEKQLKKHVMKK